MTHYAILGGGRLARHVSHYLSLLDIPHSRWARDKHPTLNTHKFSDPSIRLAATLEPASHALMLVTDDAINKMLRRYPALHEKSLVHCSGSLSFPGVAGAHPLMTFSHELYSLEQYLQIPFMVDSGYIFSDILPGFPNPHFPVEIENKPRYHALCVMAGNFVQILWQAAGARFTAMGLPASTLLPYLKQVSANFVDHPETSLTGPLSRGDHATLQRNLNSLEADPLQAVYQAFVGLYCNEQQTRQPAEWTKEAVS